jgi:cytochrome P450
MAIPPGPRLTAWLYGAAYVADRRRTMARMRRRFGPSYSLNVPVFGRTVFVSEPALAKQVFTADQESIGVMEPNLGRLFGPATVFNQNGAAHRRQRKVLMPAFHGQRVLGYAGIVEQETRREAAGWPQDRPFETHTPMARITLNVILRAVFGADGGEFDALRQLLPPMVDLGSRIFVLPIPRIGLGGLGPWGRFRAYRRRYDELVDALIDKAEADPAGDSRTDVLALLLRARYDDGTAISRRDIADQLLTLLAAGYGTTATTLAWAVERLRRHPALLARLVQEDDEGGRELRLATIKEVQRIRPTVDLTGRQVLASALPLGRWSVPRGYTVVVAIEEIHRDDTVFPHAATFDPDRFVAAAPETYSWVPFGGGSRRCIGEAFATMEMDVVLRTLLRDFELVCTDEPDEDWKPNGVTYVPARGGVAVLHRRASDHNHDHDHERDHDHDHERDHAGDHNPNHNHDSFGHAHLPEDSRNVS